MRNAFTIESEIWGIYIYIYETIENQFHMKIIIVIHRMLHTNISKEFTTTMWQYFFSLSKLLGVLISSICEEFDIGICMLFFRLYASRHVELAPTRLDALIGLIPIVINSFYYIFFFFLGNMIYWIQSLKVTIVSTFH